MIVVKNLTKIYTTVKDQVLALDSVNFTLPDKGLVFIVGKSGSGKSTLINMIGGLDDITEGEILIDGMSIGKLNQFDLDEYHNNYLGIIYQNYNLFNEETVLENVLISNRIAKNQKSIQEVDSLLDKVELSQKRNVPVSNLSGGQKQRVAIARALVKDPKLILADEPTGNLDNKTTKTIFNLLKKISKDKLVIVITHDVKSALNYADRILKISDGRIAEDLTKNTSDTTKEWNYLELEDSQEISDEKIKELNKAIKSTKYRVIRKGHHFIPTEQHEEVISDNKAKKEKRSKPVFKRSILTGLKAAKRNIFPIIATSLINMFVIGLLSLASCFVHFRGESAIRDVSKTYNINNLILRKTYSKTKDYLKLEEKRYIEVTNEDEEMFRSYGFNGDLYPLYNMDLFYIGGSHGGTYSGRYLTFDGVEYENFYPMSGYGAVNCDKAYLENIFGKDYQVLAGSIYETSQTWKVIVPDYVADSILFYNPDLKSADENDPYQKLLSQDRINYRYCIGAVIKTDYKEKYSSFLEVLGRMIREPQNASEIRKAILQSDLFVDYMNDVQSYLNYCYSIIPDFYPEYKKHVSHGYLGNSTYFFNDDNVELELNREYYVYRSSALHNDEAFINIDNYNAWFGTNITTEDDPSFQDFYITIRNYGLDDTYKENPKHEIKLHVIGLRKMSSGNFYVAYENAMKIKDWNLYQYGWTYTNVQECYNIYEKLTPHYFFNPIECFAAVYKTINIVSIFAEVFSVLMFVLLGILAVVIIMHNLRTIKKEQYRFGVYKSLGYSSLYLTIVILVTNVLMLLAIFALSSVFSYGTSFLANYLLQAGFAKYHSNRIFFKITLLSFNFKYTALYNLLTLGIMFVSSFVPLLVIRKIKPSKIIRNAE